jgi:hypothetical protein
MGFGGMARIPAIPPNGTFPDVDILAYQWLGSIDTPKYLI